MSAGYEKPEIPKEVPDAVPAAWVLKENNSPTPRERIKDSKKINFISNRVDAKSMRKVQSAVLEDLTRILVQSFGPHGSNTCIKKLNAFNMYTKDGHTILSNVFYNGIIEQSVVDDIVTITKHIAETVGDGTTSAVLLSKSLFDLILQDMENHPEYSASDIMNAMAMVGAKMDERIRAAAKPATLTDIHNIAFTSSNGNAWVAKLISDIYAESGMEVFIDVAPTTSHDTTIKTYDGMTLDSGMMDSVFVTDSVRNVSVVDHPQVYFFDDPIDTKEMGVLLDAIVSANIITPLRDKRMKDLKPTVIVAPKISRDMSSFMDIIVQYQTSLKPGNRLPITFVLNRTQTEQLRDIALMCNAKSIYKYIDASVYAEDVASGRAPTPENIAEFAGHCDSVECGTTKTKFVKPCMMTDENGAYTVQYKNLLAFVEAEIKKNQTDGGNIRELGTLKRRLHALKSNLVEIHVGGMTAADRDALLHLVEDSVKNCRSAAEYGVGWGANVSGLLAIADLEDEEFTAENAVADSPYRCIVCDLCKAYRDLLQNLYGTHMSSEKAADEVMRTMENRMPLDLRNHKYDGMVQSSIESDTIIMNSVMKIIGIMVTCNQFLTPTAQHNVYMPPQEII